MGEDSKENFKKLYDDLKPIVWVIKVKGRKEEAASTAKPAKPCVSYLTGFTVSTDGHILTCDQGNWNSWTGRSIKVRRLVARDGFEFDAELVAVKTIWNVSLIKIIDQPPTLDIESGNLSHGKLEVGENIVVIGHPRRRFVGSCLVGKSAYACTDLVQNDFNDGRVCKNFVSNPHTQTPPYRIMGHVFYKQHFTALDIEAEKMDVTLDLDYEKNLHPRLPIIQCCGFIGGDGSAGAPIFNMSGEIVGMLALQANGYQIGIHVTGLKEFLKENKIVKKDTAKVSFEGVGRSSSSHTTRHGVKVVSSC